VIREVEMKESPLRPSQDSTSKLYCRVHGWEWCLCNGRHLQDTGGEA